MTTYTTETRTGEDNKLSPIGKVESHTVNSIGELFRAVQKAIGWRCRGLVYHDTPDAVFPVGWTFTRKKERVVVTVHPGSLEDGRFLFELVNIDTRTIIPLQKEA